MHPLLMRSSIILFWEFCKLNLNKIPPVGVKWYFGQIFCPWTVKFCFEKETVFQEQNSQKTVRWKHKPGKLTHCSPIRRYFKIFITCKSNFIQLSSSGFSVCLHQEWRWYLPRNKTWESGTNSTCLQSNQVKRGPLEITLIINFEYCVHPENIHTPQRRDWNFLWGFCKTPKLEEVAKLYGNSQRGWGGGGVLEKIPSMGEVWIFSGLHIETSSCFKNTLMNCYFEYWSISCTLGITSGFTVLLKQSILM